MFNELVKVQDKEEIIKDMQAVIHQMVIDDIEENPDIVKENIKKK